MNISERKFKPSGSYNLSKPATMFMSDSPPPPSVTADEKGGTRDREEQTLFHFHSMPEKVAATLRLLISYLRLSLRYTGDSDSHPITKNLQKLELGKLIFTFATTATLGLVFSPGFPRVEAHYFVVVGFMVGCALIWNGLLFGIISLQLLGITLIMCLLCLLVGSFLPIAFFWACCLPAALFLAPFIYLLMILKPQAAAGEDDADC